MQAGDRVTLRAEPGAIVPAGSYTVSRVNPDGSFHVGGNTAVWPNRIKRSHDDLAFAEYVKKAMN